MTDQLPGIEVLPLRPNGPRGSVKAFLLYDESSVVLVDTGFSDSDGELVLDRLRERVTPSVTSTAIVLTHGHGDHTGGLRRIRQEFGWEVAAHPLEFQTLRGDGIEPSISLADGDRWQECGGLRFIHMPGHTTGSLAVYHEPTGALIAGDCIVSAGQHLMVSPPFLSEDPAQAHDSVAALLASGIEITAVLVAHGENVYRDASAPLARILAPSRVTAGG